MSKNKNPSHLYVAAKIEEEIVDRGLPTQQKIQHRVGFLHPHTLDKAGAKRRETQNYWAYAESMTTFYLIGDVMWQKGKKMVQDNEHDTSKRYTCRMEQFERPVQADLQPVIIENVPLTGFRVLSFVARMATLNKVWRVMDPRGYEFEISTKSFGEIVLNSTIIRGEIMAPCVWRGNTNLVLA